MTRTSNRQEVIDKKNQAFWNELCGSTLAKHLGITDSSKESLAKFDKYYMDCYPYLTKYFPIENMAGKKVLEIGLGYGTMAQYLATNGVDYHGLDIADNAVAMTKHRLEQHNIQGHVTVGSMLECPYPDNFFDFVVSIGCFHHTGSVQKCVDQTHRILKPGGKAIIMVYNKFSLRQWVKWPKATTQNLICQSIGKKIAFSPSEQQRHAYDASTNGVDAAPETEFFSIRDLKRIFQQYQTCKVTRENFDDYFKFELWKFPTYDFGPRSDYLNSKWSRFFGLDLYVEAIKKQ